MFPIHLNLGFRLNPHYEGLYFLIAIMLGVILCRIRLNKNGIKHEQFDAFTLWVLIGAIIGGRLSHFIFWNAEMLITKPWTILFVWDGGISILGGLGGGILGALIFSKTKKFPFWKAMALVTPIVLLSQAVGRIGCFLNGDAHGIRTTLPWGVKFPKYGYIVPPFKLDTTRTSIAWNWAHANNAAIDKSTHTLALHPTQIYEALGDLLIMGLLLLLYKQVKKGKFSEKIIFFVYAGLSAILRFSLNFIRADNPSPIPWLGISGVQLTLLGVFLLCTVLTVKLFLGKKKLAA